MRFIASLRKSKTFLFVFITVIYFLAGKFGLSLASINPSISPVWPPTGIALVTLLLFGYRMHPAILLGAFFINVTTAGNILTSFGVAIGNTLEALLGAYLVNKFAGGRYAFEKVGSIFRFAFLAGFCSTMASATIGTLSLALGGFVPWDQYGSSWLTWWLGDAGGNFVIAPLLLVWANNRRLSFRLKKFLTIILLFSLLFVAAEVVFSGILPYAYLTLPIIISISFLLGQRWSVLATLLLAVLATRHTFSGFGPFAHEATANQSLILLQLYMGTVMLTSLTLAAARRQEKSVRKELEHNERRYRALIEHSSDGIILVDESANIVYASASTQNILGYEPKELVGKSGFFIVEPSHTEVAKNALGELLAHPDKIVKIEFRVKRKDGAVIWTDNTGSNLLDEPGVGAIVINFRDITERKFTQEGIAREKVEDEALIASIGDGIVATDAEGKIASMNRIAEFLTGWKFSEVKNKLWFSIMNFQNEEGKTLSPEQRPMYLALTAGQATNAKGYYVRKNKTKFPTHTVVTPIVLEGKIIGSVSVIRDITIEKEVDQMKTEFLSMAAHQLRSPLSIMRWNIESLLKKKLSPLIKEKVNAIYQNDLRVITLVNDLLNVSRLEQGRYADDPTLNDVGVLVHQVIEEQKKNLEDKGLTLFEKIDEVPKVKVDAKRVVEVIQNILSNAIKYNVPKGEITVTLTSEKTFLKLTVVDTGLGIPKKDLPHIFERFFRGTNVRMSTTEGTGLGMFVVQSFVHGWGGMVDVKSTEGTGTTVSVTFPLKNHKENVQ